MEPTAPFIAAIGLMSGTSLDGVDAALVMTDGVAVAGFGPSAYRPYSAEEREMLRRTTAEALAMGPLMAATADWGRAEAVLTAAHAEAVAALRARIAAGDPAPSLIGFHGQTLLHRPEKGISLQIGDAAALAAATGLDVVADFRRADVAAGGEGAPLAPVYHFALARRLAAETADTRPFAILNLGGVANVTFLDPLAAEPTAAGALLACDVGPANAQLDDFVRARSGASFDAEGRIAAAGRADRELVAKWIETIPFFEKKPPKSLDRADMDGVLDDLAALSLEDGAATLTAFTAAAVAASQRFAPKPPTRWLAAGGGRLNPTLMAALAGELDAPVEPIDAAGFDGDMLEAQAFAHLAARSRRGLALSIPTTTGAPRPITGGAFAPAAAI